MRLTKNHTAAFIVDYQDKILPAIYGKDELLKNSTILIRGLKALEVPMIMTTQYAKGLGDNTQVIRDAAGELPVFDKNYFSLMDVDEIMKALPAGTQNIILMGIETHICIQQTAIDLLANGYQVYIPVDCVSAGSKEDHETGLLRMRQEGAWMSTSESLMMEMLRQASGPVFKEISNLLKERRR